MKTRTEKWTSSENREEIHYFENDMETYYFGYNPEIIPYDVVRPIIEWLESQP